MSLSVGPENSLNRLEQVLASVKGFTITLYVFENDQREELTSLVKKYHLRLVRVPPFKIVEEIRERQIKEGTCDWVLILDYDEVVTKDLFKEINTAVYRTDYSAYAILRRNYSLGYPLSHGGFGDDYVTRLFYRTSFVSWPKNIHSTPTYQGDLGMLDNYLEHHKDESLSDMVAKTNRYSDIEAKLFFDGGMAPVTTLTLIRKPIMEFIRRYIFKRGFQDGAIGLLQSLYQGYSVFITYAKLYEKQRNK